MSASDARREALAKIHAFGQAMLSLGRSERLTVAAWAEASSDARSALADLEAAIDQRVIAELAEWSETFCRRLLHTQPAELLGQLEKLAGKDGAR